MNAFEALMSACISRLGRDSPASLITTDSFLMKSIADFACDDKNDHRTAMIDIDYKWQSETMRIFYKPRTEIPLKKHIHFLNISRWKLLNIISKHIAS